MDYALKGLKISQDVQNKVEINHSHIVLSKIFGLQKKYPLSILHAEKALKIGQEIDHPAEITMAAKQLYEIYKETNFRKLNCGLLTAKYGQPVFRFFKFGISI